MLLALACALGLGADGACQATEEDDGSLSLDYSVDEELPDGFSDFVRGGFGATRPAQPDTVAVGTGSSYIADGFRPNSFEISKQYVLGADPGVNNWRTGWRFDAFVEDASVGVGQEAIASEDREPIWNSLSTRALFRGFERQAYVSGGLRINDYQSSHDFLLSGSILGEVSSDVESDHLSVGPQIGFGLVAQNAVWRLEALMLGFGGYQHAEHELNGVLGQELVPGAINRPINGRTTTTTIVGLNEDDFAWGFETRLTAGAQLTKHWRFDTIWRWAVVGPIYDASEAIGYTVPNLSLQPTSGDDEYVSDLFLGLTYAR